VFDLAATDETLRSRGLVNVKTDVPFGASPVRITFENATEANIKALEGTDGLGILTVKTSVADAVAEQLAVTRPKLPGYAIRVTRTDLPETELTVFRLTAQPSGMTLIVR